MVIVVGSKHVGSVKQGHRLIGLCMCRQYVGYAASHAATLPPFPPWENGHGIKIKISVIALNIQNVCSSVWSKSSKSQRKISRKKNHNPK